MFWYNFFYSLFYGEKAPNNPWRATTLEWTLPSPVTLHGNFEKDAARLPRAVRVQRPGMEDDYLPQNVPMREVKRTGVESGALREQEPMHNAPCGTVGNRSGPALHSAR